MSIEAALERLYEHEAGLSITDPAVVSVKRVYRLYPPQTQTLAELPCILNEFTFGQVDQRRMWAMREFEYQVQITCVVAPSTVQDDRNAGIALALFERFFETVCQDVSLTDPDQGLLNRNATTALLRGGQPTVGFIQHGGAGYIGFTAFLDVRVEQEYLWR